jgi:hypothetical protein
MCCQIYTITTETLRHTAMIDNASHFRIHNNRYRYSIYVQDFDYMTPAIGFGCVCCLGGLRLTGLELNQRSCGHKGTGMKINNA